MFAVRHQKTHGKQSAFAVRLGVGARQRTARGHHVRRRCARGSGGLLFAVRLLRDARQRLMTVSGCASPSVAARGAHVWEGFAMRRGWTHGKDLYLPCISWKTHGKEFSYRVLFFDVRFVENARQMEVFAVRPIESARQRSERTANVGFPMHSVNQVSDFAWIRPINHWNNSVIK